MAAAKALGASDDIGVVGGDDPAQLVASLSRQLEDAQSALNESEAEEKRLTAELAALKEGQDDDDDDEELFGDDDEDEDEVSGVVVDVVVVVMLFISFKHGSIHTIDPFHVSIFTLTIHCNVYLTFSSYSSPPPSCNFSHPRRKRRGRLRFPS